LKLVKLGNGPLLLTGFDTGTLEIMVEAVSGTEYYGIRKSY
jgi:hypothetical protein